MVSRVPFVHMTSYLSGRSQFLTLVVIVVAVFALYTAPVLALFTVFQAYVIVALLLTLLRRSRPTPTP
jgi:hypothetical protein